MAERFYELNTIVSMSVHHPSARNILSSIAVMMFAMAFTRRAATRALVQGFSTHSSGLVARSFLATSSSNFRQFSAHQATQVDEDLDAALDDLLGNALKAERPAASEITVKVSKPVTPKAVENVSLCDFVRVAVSCSLTLSWNSARRSILQISRIQSFCLPAIRVGWKLACLRKSSMFCREKASLTLRQSKRRLSTRS